MPNYWLLKTEPTGYSYADLEGEGTTRWTGVANPVAKKYLRAMEVGDWAFVYHTGKEKQIVGIAEVVGEGEEPQLRAHEWLKRPVTLATVKSRKEFADFALVRIGRLSVMPVSAKQWKMLLTMAV